MKALSIKQPWAWAIIHQHKDIENRTWNTKHRGEFYVHASKGFDYKAPKSLVKDYQKAAMNGEAGTDTGGIIGTVELVNVVQKNDSYWFEGPYGFILKNPKGMGFITVKGQLGFFEVSL